MTFERPEAQVAMCEHLAVSLGKLTGTLHDPIPNRT